MPMGVDSSGASYLFQTFADAYNVKPVDVFERCMVTGLTAGAVKS